MPTLGWAGAEQETSNKGITQILGLKFQKIFSIWNYS